jgi:hypothetical protein
LNIGGGIFPVDRGLAIDRYLLKYFGEVAFGDFLAGGGGEVLQKLGSDVTDGVVLVTNQFGDAFVICFLPDAF